MRKTLFLVFAFCTLLMGAESAERPVEVGHIDASANNIGATYGSGAGSQILSNLASISSFTCLNDTASDILVSLGEGTNCSGSDVDHFYIPAGLGYEPNRPIAVKNVICVRSLSGTIAAGDVWCSAH